MKKRHSVLLSDDAYKLLKEKSIKFRIPIYKVVESMIMEFSNSTPEEKATINAIYKRMQDKFIENNPNATLRRAWKNGYNAGWTLFQLRKTTSMFEKYKKQLKG